MKSYITHPAEKKMCTRQRIIIGSIFGVYFDIVKMRTSHHLLEPALQGMSNFAHLINVELVLEVIATISEKWENEGDKLSLICKLHSLYH